MNTIVSFQYPAWFILFCLALGAVYALVLYYREQTYKNESSEGKFWKLAMGTFRFLSVSFLAILLLSPYFKSRHTQKFKPVIAVIHDNSESVKSGLKGDTTQYEKNLNNLIRKLSEKYEIAQYSTGDGLKQGIHYTYSDKSTDLSNALEETNALYYNLNLGAVILASDGIYNKGVSPVYAAIQSAYPVYTIALGDTSIQRDQKIATVKYNKIVYLNDRFVLRVDVESNNLAGKEVNLNVYEVVAGREPKLLQTKNVAYTSPYVFQSFDFILPTEQTGIARYRVVLSNTEGEVTYKNNTRDVFLEVLDGRQKILLVAHSPHPDIAALRGAIESNKNYQLEVEYAESFSKKLDEYNLVILHQLPSGTQKIQNILNEASQKNKSLLFVVGSQTSLVDLQKAQPALSIKANADRFNEVTAVRAKDFSLFTLSDYTTQTISKLPPFSSFFGAYTINPSSKVLLYQKINAVETDFPLWLFYETGETKTGVLAGEGIWRWRLNDFLLNKNHGATNELFNKTVQYLAVKSDKRPFRVNLAKNIFQDNEAIIFDAQLYNSNYELVNTGEVDLKIVSDEGNSFEHKFSKTDNSYNLNVGFLPVGNYSYTATAKMSSSTAHTVSGKFSVSPVQLEDLNTRADYNVLYQLAQQRNGVMHNLENMENIAEEIDARNQLKPILFDTFTTTGAVDLKWFLFVLLALISAEWFIRKYLGGY